MEQQLAPVCAAIDVGSNTIHVVVARCFPTTLEILADELELARIGESVTASGEISAAKTEAAVAALLKYRALAEKLGATEVLVVATEAIRQARNNAAFLAQIKERTGLEVLLISGKAEAALTFLGATYEAGPHKHISVMDLGGGSLELVFAREQEITWRTSVPLGSGWLHDHYLSANPPSSHELKAAQSFLKTYMRDLPKNDAAPLIVTGGSANSLLLLAQKAFHLPSDKKYLTSEDLARCQGLLSSLQAEDISALYDQPLARAKVLLAGTLIIKHAMRRLGLREVLVSPHGIREGILLALARFGENWLVEAEREERSGETFAHAAHRVLLERLHTMLDRTEEVMKHEDVEAVHRMRVASRRLRAALDAYQPCCEPRLFRKIYRQVKEAANALGSARDADVMLQYLQQQLEANLDEDEQAGVRWLEDHLRDYRQQQQEHLDDFLRHFDAEQMQHQLKKSVRERTDK
ncbi:MAG TPA: CHAD domain-containing protein [Ktedonobacteraceae bacterium]